MSNLNQQKLQDSEEAHLRGDYKLVARLCQEVLLSENEHSPEYIDANRQMARLELMQAEYRSALKRVEDSLVPARMLNDPVLLGKLYSVAGTVHYNTSDYDIALQEYQIAIDYFTKAQHDYWLAINYANLANVYFKQTIYGKALENYEIALGLSEKSGNKNSALICYGNLGIMYKELGDIDLSMEYCQKGLSYAIETDNKMGLMNAYTNIGLLFMMQKIYPHALEYIEKTLAIAKELNQVQFTGVALSNIGLIYYYLRDYDKALEYSLQGLSITEAIGNRQGSAVIYQNLGLLYSNKEYHQHDYRSAETYLNKAIELYTQTGIKFDLLESRNLLANVYRCQKRWEEFAEEWSRIEPLREVVENEQLQKRMTSFHLQRDIALKEAEHRAVEKILHKILPNHIANRIRQGEEKIIQRFDQASVLFADMVGFTQWSSERDIHELADTLNRIFNLFDELALQFGVEKIKTIGDAYMCVSGLPIECEDHAIRIGKMALAMMEKLKEQFPNGEIQLRIGIHSGEVIAGVLGKHKYAYDLWGDTVNIASRMESHGQANKIQVSDLYKNSLSDRFRFKKRELINIKGKGLMQTWFLEGE